MVHLDKLPGTFFGPSTLVDLVRHRADHQPNDTAFVYLVDGETEQVDLTYGHLDEQARAIAARLQSLGLAGQRALLLYPAGLEFIAAFFGCLYAEVVAVPVYPPRRNRSLTRIQSIADDCDARVALTTDVVLQRVERLVDETPHLKELTWLPTSTLPAALADEWKKPEIGAETLAFLQYTSGSTGTPKGVMLNHASLLHNSALIAYGFEHTRSGTGVYWLPSYHDMGLIGGILQPLYIGRPNVMMSPMSFLQKPARWLQAITRFGATTIGGPNFAYDLCVAKVTPEQLDGLDLSRWQVAFNGAEPVRAETLERFAEKFAPCGFRPEAFYPCYGMAEATLIVSGSYARELPVVRCFDVDALARGKAVDVEQDAEASRELVGCGKALVDQKIVIADPQTLTRCPDKVVGEIWVQGPSVAQGYWQQPEVTKTIFQAHLKPTGDGPFLRTGDLGFLEDGELFVTGRLKDLIILHGVNHYPQDIEVTVQHAHKRLRRNCGGVFTIEEDGREKCVVVQEIERRKQGRLDEVFHAIRRAVSAEHELGIDAIVLIKAATIPKTSSGKIQRHACRAAYLDGTLDVIGQWKLGQGEEAILAVDKRKKAKRAAKTIKAETPKAASPAHDAPRTAIRPGANTPASKNGRKPGAKSGSERVAELVLEQVREIAKERAVGLTLDSMITEMGLDSLERMEILASLEERFGGRFPEEILPDLETCRQVVEAVEKYLGTEPRPQRTAPSDAEIPTAHYRIAEFPEYVQLKQSLDMAEALGLGNPFFTVHQGITNDRTLIDGRELINFSSYNYVGMSGDPVVVKAAQDAAARYGTSVSASRLVSGEKVLHGELEREIAQFLGVEDAVCFVGGHSTNETVIGHLMKPGDLILHDALSHNSIVQGSILSGARRRPFAHNDWEAADRLLSQLRHEYRRVLMVIEGVYSMDGDIPNLPKFIEVKQRHKALLMIDEAHSIGTLGDHGRGIGEHFDVVREDVDIWMATLSKTFGSCGGYIAGSKELVQYLKYTAPGFVYSVGLSPPNAGAALASLRLLQAQPERVARVQQRSRLFLTLAKQRGLNTGRSKDSPVVPVILGNSVHCLRLSRALFERGVNVQPILYPAVEESAARLRFFLTSQHTEGQIRFTVDAMAEALEKINPEYLTQALGS
ncbi:MAG: aminotransferase class I/II-fold pyridoxal phosphate-dependent enzyme [Planctomycetia bacterium]|nr:aminotransferase class I/II-fold pyridoxal phosphate-dependent enzyme [Planctomycetia bacterium]